MSSPAIGLLAVCAATLASAGSTAAAGEGPTERADFRLEFTSKEAGSPTGARLYILYKAPGDSDAKPSPIRRAVIEAPEGTRYGLDRIPACDASDEQLRTNGQSACEEASRVGAGSLTAVTGFGPPFDPFPTEVTLFNTGKGFLELVEQEEPRATLAVDRAVVQGNTAELNPPSTPGGPPDGQTAVREIDLRFDRPSYLTTPPSCPADERWRSRGVFTFADGVTVAVPHSMPCVATDPPPPASASPCLARRSPVGSRKLGRIRLSAKRTTLLRLPVQDPRRTRRSLRWCVKGSRGRVAAVFGNDGQAHLVVSTARGHGNRGVRPGVPLAMVRAAYRHRRSLAGSLLRAGPRGRLLIGARRGRVQFVGVATPALLGKPAALRRAVGLAGLQRER